MNPGPHILKLPHLNELRAAGGAAAAPGQRADPPDSSDDPRLDALRRGWPGLPESVRAAVFALVEAVRSIDPADAGPGGA